MATRRDDTGQMKKKAASPVAAPKPVPRKAATPRKAAKAKPAAAPAKARAPGNKPGAQALLSAGLKALGDVRDGVVQRQTNVIESLLGMTQGKTEGKAKAGQPLRGFPGAGSFGIRKFEDVFDQRVATALQRLGMPSAQEIQALREQMGRLLEHLERVEAAGRKKR